MTQSAKHNFSVFERITDAIIALDKNWHFTYINNKAGQVFNSRPDSIIGKDIWTAFPEYLNTSFYKACFKAMEDQQPVSLESFTIQKDSVFQINIYPSTDGLTVFLKAISKTSFIEEQLKKAEKELHKSNERFALVAKATDDMIWYWNFVTDEVWWNKNYTSLFGYDDKTEYLPISSWEERIYPDDRQRVSDGIYKIIGSGEKFWTDEYRYLKNDGTVLNIYDRGYVMYDESGKPCCMVGSMLNITEKIEAQAAVKDSEEKYRTLVEQASDAIFIMDEKGKIITVNTSACELSQCSKAELLQMSIFDFALFEDLQNHPFHFEELKRGIAVVSERPMKSRDGSIATVEINAKMITDGRILVFIRNITERIKAQQAIKESEEKYRNLFERASDSLVLHDMNGTILDLNSTASDLSGFSKEELVRMNITDILIAEDLKKLPIPFDKLAAGEISFNRRRVKTKSGVIRVMDVSSKMMPDRIIMSMIRDVTERSEAEKALRNSELRHRVLTANVPVGIFETDAAGNTIYVNEKIKEYTGLDFSDLLGTNWIESVHPEDRDKVKTQWKQNVANQKESISEYRLINKKDGSIRWVSGKAVTLLDKNEQLIGYLGTLSDITREKLSWLALQESEERYRTLVEQAADAIYISDTSGRLITVNPSACKLSGYTENELLQLSIHDFVKAEELEKEPLRINELIEGKTVIVKRNFRKKNGEYFIAECIANLLSDGRILVFARDITERLRVENSLKESEEKYRTLVEQASEGIYIADSKGKILSVNPSTCKITQYSEEELLQMTIYDFVPMGDLEKYSFHFDELKQGKTVISERRMIQKNGNILDIENTKKLLSNGTILVFMRDISERIKAKQLLEKSYKDIRRLAVHLTQVREDERKRIGREIHDELGQQLTAIKMDVVWIDKKTPDEKNPIKNNLKNIVTLLDSTNLSVRRILSELSTGIIDDDGLLDAIARQNQQFAATTGKSVKFTTAETKVILSQEIANCIFRVYQESLTNIIRHAEADKVVTSLNIIDGSIIVTIEDDGKGFDINEIQVKKSFGLLGMKERVLSQNGEFELRTEKGKGTKIKVILPYKTGEI